MDSPYAESTTSYIPPYAASPLNEISPYDKLAQTAILPYDMPTQTGSPLCIVRCSDFVNPVIGRITRYHMEKPTLLAVVGSGNIENEDRI